MRFSSRALLPLLLIACATAATPPAPPVPLPGAPRLAAELRTAQLAPDTLVMSASWVNPVDDGRGPLDSLKVRFLGIQDDTSYIFRPPLPSSQVRRQVIPSAAYSPSGSATYPVLAQLTTYRRALNAPPLDSSPVQITLLDAAPPNVTGISFSAIKRP